MKKLFILTSFLCLTACTHQAAPPQKFMDAYNIVKQNYVKNISDEELVDNAIKGMLEGLDEHSTYLDKKDLESLDNLTMGQYTGIGVEVIPDEDSLKVVSPLDDSPAQKAGILPEDHIVEVNKKALANLNYVEMIQLLRGTTGSQVDLTIIRAHETKPLYFKLNREKLTLQNIKSKLYPQGIGYIRIAFFQENTAPMMQKELIKLQQQNQGPLKGLILDLRNNPGGLLQSATAVSDLFLDYHYMGNNRMIVYSKNRDGQVNYMAKADDKDYLNHAPMVILINKGSASGSEIVAGALHDHHRATLVGTQSFGKGSVQAIIPLDNDGALKLTTALYYTPNGDLIDHIGIPPDIEVKTKLTDKTDTVLNRGLEILKNNH